MCDKLGSKTVHHHGEAVLASHGLTDWFDLALIPLYEILILALFQIYLTRTTKRRFVTLTSYILMDYTLTEHSARNM